ncbi:unnamed protein product, partial [Laminaria digitata]
MSHVQVSFEVPEYTANADGIGTLRILDAVRLLGLEKKTRIYQASTSELYGKVQEVPQSETTPFYPRSPYAVAKMYAYWITVNYREAYGMYACNGILFNHESPIRGETFVTRKITRAVSRIALGLQDKFYLGNLDAQRDWGHAKDYVRMMWMILQAEEAEDWVIATGKTTSVRDFVRMSFEEVGIQLEFKGSGVNEKAFVKACNNTEYQIEIGKEILCVDPKYFRPTEVDLLIGDPTKAKTKLGWETEYKLLDLVKDMMQSDLKLMQKDQFLKESGRSFVIGQNMDKDSKIYIAGHNGLVGSALLNNLKAKGFTNLITRTSSELDLRESRAVESFFISNKPEYVFLAAAKVGGIVANNVYRGEFIFDNLMIQNNVIHYSYLNGVKKLMFLGSTCIYPKECPQPMKEDYLLTGPLEYTNEPYAIAKIAGIKMCESYNIQYGTNFISVMPTNLYGPNDNFDLEKSHVLPALVRKMHLGKALLDQNWTVIRSDLDRLPIEGISGKAQTQEITDILSKYGVTIDNDG